MDDEKKGYVAYGRGFRRCFESMRRNPPLRILFGAGNCDEECLLILREHLKQHSQEALKGFDSLDLSG